MKNFVEELKWRGMLAQIMPGTEEYLQEHLVSAYLGTDPTADSLHIGHLCGIMMLRHLQRCGHKPYLLVGGATGMIGDPSGKSQERNLLDEATLLHNQEAIKKQVSKFLDFDSTEPNKAELVNNYDWMKNFTFLDFAREVGKHITVNYMMAKDSVQKRLNGEARDGLSFTEFTYQLLHVLTGHLPGAAISVVDEHDLFNAQLIDAHDDRSHDGIVVVEDDTASYLNYLHLTFLDA